jgi:hypothetical protein
VVSELRRFQRRAGVMLAAVLLAVSAVLALLGYRGAISGLLAGGLLGFANLTWMVSTATRLMRHSASARSLQAVALVRFLVVAALLGLILVVGHVHPIGAVVGYALFPIVAAAAGWRFLGNASVPL